MKEQHPRSGELSSEFPVWDLVSVGRPSAVKYMLWRLGIDSALLATADRMALVALAFHMDLVLDAGGDYEGSLPEELMVWTGNAAGTIRAKLKTMCGYGWCDVIPGPPMRFRPTRPFMDLVLLHRARAAA